MQQALLYLLTIASGLLNPVQSGLTAARRLIGDRLDQ